MPPIKSKKHHSAGTAVEITNVLGSGASKIKTKIRDIERLLKKKGDVLPADVVVAQERALETLKVELENAQMKNKVKEVAKKYHMVRFFEKKKSLRKYRQAKKEYDALVEKNEGKKEIKKARTKLRHAEVDLCYVVNFPKDKKYISLFPNKDSADAKDENVKKGLLKTEEQRNAFKKEIESMLKEDTLPISLKDILDGKSGERTTLASNFETQKEEEVEANEDEDQDDFFE